LLFALVLISLLFKDVLINTCCASVDHKTKFIAQKTFALENFYQNQAYHKGLKVASQLKGHKNVTMQNGLGCIKSQSKEQKDKKLKKDLEKCQGIKSIDELAENIKVFDQILVFVSFSMPKASIESLLNDSKFYQSKLILRGLKDDSFVKTAQVLKDYANAKTDQTNNGANLEINPELFTKYKIEKVPVFIMVKGDKVIGKIAGNVSLKFAHDKILGLL
jgi:type-F conjugative transfer system pilin assembly protein TrbC